MNLTKMLRRSVKTLATISSLLACSLAFAQKKIQPIDPPKNNASANNFNDLMFGYMWDTMGNGIIFLSIAVYALIGIALALTFKEATEKGKWGIFGTTVIVSIIFGSLATSFLLKAQNALPT